MQIEWQKQHDGKGSTLIEIGDLDLRITRMNHEWRLHYQWNDRGNEGCFSLSQTDDYSEQEESEMVQERVAMERMSNQFRLTPELADRAVIVRPYSPLTIPANNRITLYVSVPLWLCVHFSETVQFSLPVQQLSESWMGSMTGDGELCYGSYSHARLDEKLLLKRPYRALTPVTMYNQGNKDSRLERLSIPAPYLSLFQGKDQLITEPLKISMDSERHRGVVEIGSTNGEERISPPRRTADKGVLVSTWENLFA